LTELTNFNDKQKKLYLNKLYVKTRLRDAFDFDADFIIDEPTGNFLRYRVIHKKS